jgi:2-oxoglutarate ferredoxin oxidoreductase subunit gamma
MGGQGVILSGRLLAQAALPTVPHLTFFPAYGAEVRGGVSNCQIVLSSESIPSPVSEIFDTLLFLDADSVRRFGSARAEHSLVLVNSSLCDEAPAGAVRLPATERAAELGTERAANFVMLGALLARKPVVPLKDLEETMRRALASKGDAVLNLNLKALHAGLRM